MALAVSDWGSELVDRTVESWRAPRASYLPSYSPASVDRTGGRLAGARSVLFAELFPVLVHRTWWRRGLRLEALFRGAVKPPEYSPKNQMLSDQMLSKSKPQVSALGGTRTPNLLIRSSNNGVVHSDPWLPETDRNRLPTGRLL